MESFCRVVESFACSNLVEFESENIRSCGVSLTHIAQNNPTKMDKTQDFCSQGFGHQVVRSQMPQTCCSQALWSPTAQWSNLSSVPQSLFFTTSNVVGFFAGVLLQCLWGRTLQEFDLTKDSAKYGEQGDFHLNKKHT